MNPMRPLMWGLGAVVVLVGIYMLYVEAELGRWISQGIVVAAFVVIAGFVVMGLGSLAAFNVDRTHDDQSNVGRTEVREYHTTDRVRDHDRQLHREH